MVWALVPALGAKSPSMLTNALNNSGYFTARFIAHVPPEDQPTAPQLAGSSLTLNFSTMYGTTSWVR